MASTLPLNGEDSDGRWLVRGESGGGGGGGGSRWVWPPGKEERGEELKPPAAEGESVVWIEACARGLRPAEPKVAAATRRAASSSLAGGVGGRFSPTAAMMKR